ALQVERRLFTVEEYDRLIEAGFFGPDERLELIDGEIVTMSPIGTRHSSCVVRLTDLFTQRLGMRALVSVQNPVVLGVRQEFQPDVAILRRRDDYYATRRPGPADAFLVIEVADTTFALDRSIKVHATRRQACPRSGWRTSSATCFSCSTHLSPADMPARAW